MPGRPLWMWPLSDSGNHYHLHPQVDPLGEWVAWSQNGTVHVHSLRQPSSAPRSQVQLPEPWGRGEFCDWTEDSHLLVNAVGEGRSQLAVVANDGKLVRTISTTVPPMRGSVAAYRKFGHR